MKKFKLLSASVLLLLSISINSCTTTSIVASEDSDMAQGVCTECSKTTWAYAWGLVEPTAIDPKCNNKTMTKVRAKTNLGFAFITVITGGIVIPLSVEWDCAPSNPDPGVIGQ